MTVAELVQRANEMVEMAGELDGKPEEPSNAVAHKIAKLADERGVLPSAIGADELTEEERPLLTPAVVERAERIMHQAAEKTKAKVKKVNDQRRLPILPKKQGGGWYIDASQETPDTPAWGPYATKKEAEEERSSYLKNHKPPSEKEVAKAEAKAKARSSGTGATKASEPKAANAVHTKTEGNESEDNVKTKTKTKKKTVTKAEKATVANGKPAKAKKAEKGASEKKLSALDAAYEILKNRTVPMSATDLIEAMQEKGLWKSPGGKTPDATLSAAIGREIANKGKESRFSRPESGKFLAK